MNGFAGDSVVVEAPLRLELAAREARQLGAKPPFAVLDHALDVEAQGLSTVALPQRGQPPKPDFVRGGLRSQVARHLLLGAHVGEEELVHVFREFAADEQPDDGKDDPLLVDLAERSDAGGRPAPHVDVMAAVGHVADQFAPVEEGRDEEDIVEVARLAVPGR